MTVIAWPAGVPSCILPTSPSGGLRNNRLTFETDSKMPPIERPLTSWTPEVYQVELVPMSVTQFQAFQDWYRGALKFGVNPFLWPHPITQVAGAWKIVAADPPYQVKKVGNIPSGSGRRRVSVSFSVMSWPGA